LKKNIRKISPPLWKLIVCNTSEFHETEENVRS
jgi:hypothetical protein